MCWVKRKVANYYLACRQKKSDLSIWAEFLAKALCWLQGPSRAKRKRFNRGGSSLHTAENDFLYYLWQTRTGKKKKEAIDENSKQELAQCKEKFTRWLLSRRNPTGMKLRNLTVGSSTAVALQIGSARIRTRSCTPRKVTPKERKRLKTSERCELAAADHQQHNWSATGR